MTNSYVGLRAQQIDAVCRDWYEDAEDPFVTLVASHGVIVTHEAFGKDSECRPIDRGYTF